VGTAFFSNQPSIGMLPLAGGGIFSMLQNGELQRVIIKWLRR